MRNHYTHPLEWLRLKRLIIASVIKDVEQLEFSYTADGNIKWYTLENSFLKS